MATDLERLIITIEANTKQFTRAMDALSGETNRAMRGVESSLTQAGDRIGGAFGRSLQRSLISALSINFIRQSAEAMGELGDKNAQAYSRSFDAALRAGQEGALGAFDAFVKEIQEKFETLSRLSLTTDVGKQLIGQLAQMDISSIEQTIPGLMVKLARQMQTAAKTGGGLQIEVPAIHFPGLRTVDYPGREVIVSLRQQQAEIGATAKEQEVLNNIRQAGVDIDSKYGIVIAEDTRRLYDQKQALAAINELNADLENSTKSFAQAMLEGSSATEALNTALRQLASQLLDMAFKGLFNPGGTPLLQTIFGGSFNSAPGVPGAQYGAHFKVGGIGGTDSQLVAFRATPGETVDVHNNSLGGGSGRMGGGLTVQNHTAINISGSVDQRTLAAMSGMIQRNNVRQNAELQRTWGNRQARYSALRGP
jgi:hypothetical protein